MAIAAGHDLGAEITSVRQGIANTALTAAGGGDATTITGASVDVTGLTDRFNSAVFLVGSTATMASGESLTVTVTVQDSANDSDWATLVAATAAISHTASGGAATAVQRGGKVSVDLAQADRYVRALVVPDLSRAGTDTATVCGFWAFGYPDRI